MVEILHEEPLPGGHKRTFYRCERCRGVYSFEIVAGQPSSFVINGCCPETTELISGAIERLRELILKEGPPEPR